MKPEELKLAQEKIEKEIFSLSEMNNLSNDEIEPIPDGIYSAELYLSAPKQIMWVLKEPYDDIMDGKPCDGGWCLYEAYDNDNVWTSRAWQPIIYSMYGLFNDQKWDDMDWIRDDKSMANVLKQIALINISKMPALTRTNDNSLWGKYALWRDVILKQITEYAPNIIIFGNTFKYFKNDLVGKDAKPIKNLNGLVDVYEKDGIRFLDTYHPSQRTTTRKNYINTLIESCL